MTWKTLARRLVPSAFRYHVVRLLTLRGQVYPQSIDYEPDVQRAMCAYIKTGDTVFDVGANVGIHSVIMGRLVGPTGHVHIFEANPAILGRLRDTLKVNGLLNRSAIQNVAVTNQNHNSVNLFISRDTRVKGGASTILPELSSRERLGKQVQEIRVQTITLDEYCRTLGVVPDFVKFDIEGAEFLALQGFENVLRTKGPTLVLEYGNQPGVKQGVPYGPHRNPALVFLDSFVKTPLRGSVGALVR